MLFKPEHHRAATHGYVTESCQKVILSIISMASKMITALKI